ncbi:MAG: aromatic amino acid lyase [Chitinophagales bacterium]|nr:aromatic amino acid lyase [Bacteroidota bacterium]MBP7398045.1 aromatic amino acid lyase [Chitinophagales bacterium]MBK8682343.1 aromatic amino acid lyase [Bacteroidota bacterium]MBP8753197.1 aromatic amino acid lyase [Chitinophagales bacterium]MBP9188189.1 aromatic amino acid lyase [Chitinophagales bacterium]
MRTQTQKKKDLLASDCIEINGDKISIDEIVLIANNKCELKLTGDKKIIDKINESHHFIQKLSIENKAIYGVNTGFGGMAKHILSHEETQTLQDNLIYFLKTGTGEYLPDKYVRGAMIILCNALIKGASGIRFAIIERYVFFLNNNIVPRVHELGSIGASGDLVPLSYIAGAITEKGECFKVLHNNIEKSGESICNEYNLEPIQLQPKEGLALVNSTAMLTAIAACNLKELKTLFALTLQVHAMMLQSLIASTQPFEDFIHQQKPHEGQIFIAKTVRHLLKGSSLVRKNDELIAGESRLYQDRYSIRCIPQFLGPVADGIKTINKQIEIEANSVTDNPLIDMDNFQLIHGGNFLGEYIAIAMDQIRQYVGLISKHLDAQIAMLVMPEFNSGLPSSLTGNSTNQINMGLKGLQITANSIMPMLLFYGNSIADKFPTHAEQFNQNINSQGFNSALLTAKSIDLFRKYISISLIFAVQAVDLRVRKMDQDFIVEEHLSPETYKVYKAIMQICGKPENGKYPFVFNDNDHPLDDYIKRIEKDINDNGLLEEACADILINVEHFIRKSE